MSGNIKHASWAAHLVRIDLRIQHFFSLAHRPCNALTVGIDNHAVAGVNPRSSFAEGALFEWVAVRDIGCAQRHTTTEHKDASLPGNVSQRREPGFSIVRCSGNIELRAPDIQGMTCQREIMLPTNQPTDSAKRKPMDLQCTALTLCPDQAFCTGQQERAMLAQESPRPPLSGGQVGLSHRSRRERVFVHKRKHGGMGSRLSRKACTGCMRER